MRPWQGAFTIFVDFIMLNSAGNVESRIRAPSLDEMGIADPGPYLWGFMTNKHRLPNLIGRIFQRNHEAPRNNIKSKEQSSPKLLTNVEDVHSSHHRA